MCMARRNNLYPSSAPLILKLLKQAEGSLSSSGGQRLYTMEVKVCISVKECSMRIVRGLWDWKNFWDSTEGLSVQKKAELL